MPPKEKKAKSKSKDKKGKKEPSEKGIKSSKDRSQVLSTGNSQLGGNQKLAIPERKDCVQHKSELIYFCESCEEPICSLCTTLGPHNNQLHRVNSVSKAHANRIGKMDYLLKNCLVQKRDQLSAQIYRLDYRMEEIKYVRGIIEQDAKTEFGGIVERLKSAEGVKQSVLQHMMANIQNDVDAINQLLEQFTDMTQDGRNPLEFMLKNSMFKQNIEYILEKPFQREINVTPYDLPRELASLREEIEKIEKLEEFSKFKDDVIHTIHDDSIQNTRAVTGQLDEAINDEVGEWARLAERYTTELQQYQLICYYCAEPFKPNVANSECMVNIVKSFKKDFKGFTEEAPKSSFHGTRRHYFFKPKMDIFEGPNAFRNMQLLFADAQDNPYKQTIKIQIEKSLSSLRKMVFQHNVDLMPLFKEVDKPGLGIINTITFTYVLVDKVQMKEREVMDLIKLFDPHNKNLINYMDFVRLVHDPNLMEEMPLFRLGKEPSQREQRLRELEEMSNTGRSHIPTPNSSGHNVNQDNDYFRSKQKNNKLDALATMHPENDTQNPLNTKGLSGPDSRGVEEGSYPARGDSRGIRSVYGSHSRDEQKPTIRRPPSMGMH